MDRSIKTKFTDRLMYKGFIKMFGKACRAICIADVLELSTMAVSTVFLEMSKCVDQVSCSRLLWKVKYCGTGDPSHPWIASTLISHFQAVINNNSFSKPRPITNGAVKGGALGQLAFPVLELLVPCNPTWEAVSLNWRDKTSLLFPQCFKSYAAGNGEGL